jgi:hypothetical protein
MLLARRRSFRGKFLEACGAMESNVAAMAFMSVPSTAPPTRKRKLTSTVGWLYCWDLPRCPYSTDVPSTAAAGEGTRPATAVAARATATQGDRGLCHVDRHGHRRVVLR